MSDNVHAVSRCYNSSRYRHVVIVHLAQLYLVNYNNIELNIKYIVFVVV